MNKNDNVFDVLSFIQRIERLIYNYCILLLLEGSPDAEDQETLFNGISRDSWKIIERTRSWISSDLKNVKYLLQKSCHQEAIMINRHQYGSEVCQKTTFFAGSPFFILIFYLYLPGHLKLSWLMMICVETFNQLSCNISSVHISFVFISLVNKAAPLHEYLSKNEVEENCPNLAGCLSIFLSGDQLWS